MPISYAGPFTRRRPDPFLPAGSPHEHGLDPAPLTGLEDKLLQWKIKSAAVVLHGHLVWEWYDKGTDRPASLFSCTKSVLSALIGIAVAEGKIQGVEQPISDYFDLDGHYADERKQSIRVKHLLSMTPGWDWPDFDKPYTDMKRSDDWIRFVLDRPMAHEPGQAFTYNTGGSQLLSAILTKATGQSAMQYAKEKLFGKMGFKGSRWNISGGVNEGGAGLYLSTADLLKFGLLYLRKGSWCGEQLVPEAWVEESTAVKHKGLSNYEPPIYGCYGYHWWVSPQEHNGLTDCFFAFGYGGQYLMIVPGLELVAVVRKVPGGRNNAMISRNLLFEHFFRAIAPKR